MILALPNPHKYLSEFGKYCMSSHPLLKTLDVSYHSAFMRNRDAETLIIIIYRIILALLKLAQVFE
jgi:hypothetical protein